MLCWEIDKTLCSVLERQGFWNDRKTLIWFWDGNFPLRYQRKISKKELRKSSYAFASFLIKKFGVRRGEPIAVILPNIPEFIFAYFGIWLAGGVVAPINPRLRKDEFARMIRAGGIRRVIVPDRLYPEIAAIETLNDIVVFSMSESFPFVKGLGYIKNAAKQGVFIGFPQNDKRAINFKKLLKNGRKNPSLYFPQLKPESAALMLFTSGTTGEPKAVIHTHGSLMENAVACKNLLSELLGYSDFKNEVFLAAAPYFHIMGLSTMLHLPLLVGSKIIMTFPFLKEDFGSKLLSAVSYAKVSIFVGAPKFFEMMLAGFQKNWKWKLFDFSSLKICISGSVGMPKNLRERFKRVFGKNILEGYGMSESGITHCQKNEFNTAGSVGVPMLGVEHKILNPGDDGRGEVLVRSSGLMKGYLKNGAVLNSRFFEIFLDQDGWLHTADLGYVNEKGELFLVDRKRYIIKTKHGENIIPADIVRVLDAHELVCEAAVVGRKGENDYEEIFAYVVLKKELGKEYSYDKLEGDLKEYCEYKLSSFKIPKKIHFVSELPKNIFGKILRKDLR